MIKSPWVWIHEKLTTGVHGAGPLYLAKSTTDGLDMSAHASRHNWLGADEANVYGMIAGRPYIALFSNGDGANWTLTNVQGTGSITHDFTAIKVTSGANENDHSIAWEDGYIYWYLTNQAVYFGLRFGSWSVTTDIELWVLWTDSPLVYPLNTHKYVGFKMLSTGAATACTLTAESCDGGGAGHAVSTDITNGVTYDQYKTADAAIRYTTDHIYFYINNVQLADHTTHIPSANLMLSYHAKALGAAAKSLLTYVPKIITAPVGS